MPRLVDNYEQAIEFLFGRVNYERLSGTLYSADEFKLDRMRKLLSRLGDPQTSIPAVHVAGTKGKGSTAAVIAAALSAAGIRTGLFTSPHISAFEERLAVDSVTPSAGEFVELVNTVAGVAAELDRLPGRMGPTFFELATALGWLWFRKCAAELAVLEVGMGGRLDATNVCFPLVTLVTTISRDHTRQLGSRLAEIAREKAGIAKPGVPLVCGASDLQAAGEIERSCRTVGAPLVQLGRDFNYRYFIVPDGRASVEIVTRSRRWPRFELGLIGEHQALNATLAVAALEILGERGFRVDMAHVAQALSNVRWPARIEVLARRPTVIVDSAHNWASARALARTLRENFAAARQILIFAASRDKDVAGMLRQLLPRFDCVVLTSFQNNPRNVPLEELARLARTLSERPFHIAPDPASAWKLARRFATERDLICIAGSFFIAAELRELILDSARPGQPADARNPSAQPR
jgi:dihydrofolate synthase/folylpolyglutamate synthase